MDAQNKLRWSTDAHRHNSMLRQLDAEIETQFKATAAWCWDKTQFNAVAVWCWDAEYSSLGRSLVVPLAAQGAHCKQMPNAIFAFHLFFVKAKILFGFFS